MMGGLFTEGGRVLGKLSAGGASGRTSWRWCCWSWFWRTKESSLSESAQSEGGARVGPHTAGRLGSLLASPRGLVGPPEASWDLGGPPGAAGSSGSGARKVELFPSQWISLTATAQEAPTRTMTLIGPQSGAGLG